MVTKLSDQLVRSVIGFGDLSAHVAVIKTCRGLNRAGGAEAAWVPYLAGVGFVREGGDKRELRAIVQQMFTRKAWAVREIPASITAACRFGSHYYTYSKVEGVISVWDIYTKTCVKKYTVEKEYPCLHVDRERLYLGEGSKLVVAFNRETGGVSYEIPSKSPNSKVAFGEECIVETESYEDRLTTYNPVDGTHIKTWGNKYARMASCDADKIYVGCGSDAGLFVSIYDKLGNTLANIGGALPNGTWHTRAISHSPRYACIAWGRQETRSKPRAGIVLWDKVDEKLKNLVIIERPTRCISSSDKELALVEEGTVNLVRLKGGQTRVLDKASRDDILSVSLDPRSLVLVLKSGLRVFDFAG